MIIALIKERKSPPDRRVVIDPQTLAALREAYPNCEFWVESSDIRVFSDDEYTALGFKVTSDVSGADILLGVKEVPLDALMANKSYFFFSHTIKKQPYNRKLLQKILELNIDLYDHETIVDQQNKRLIGFGRYAGLVGAYNGIRGFGSKYELFQLPKACELKNLDELIKALKKIVLPPIKIVLTGYGKVGMGAKEILDAMKIKAVSPDDFLTKKYSSAVYTHIDVLDYNKKISGETASLEEFYQSPQQFEENFTRFTKVADMFIAGHFYGDGAPVILTKEALKAKDCQLKVVADISCDIDGPVACTLRASTIAEPFYGYLPSEHKEVDMFHPGAIVVMAVDNLPCELPFDASKGFAKMFSENVFPSFFNQDANGILKRAQITSKGQLTHRFSYLEDYVNGVAIG